MKKGKKLALVVSLVCLMMLACSMVAFAAEENAVQYPDIQGHWAQGAIEYVVEEGIFAGTSDNVFAPNASMTRGMLVTVLCRTGRVNSQLYSVTHFEDVDIKAYYGPAVGWAYENNIVKGDGNGYFNPDKALTREEAAVILANYAEYRSRNTYLQPAEVASYLELAKDGDTVSSWAKDGVAYLLQSKVLTGDANGNLNPQVEITRAEVASLLQSFIKFLSAQ